MQAELIRRIVLEYLAERNTGAFTPDSITRMVNLRKLADERLTEDDTRAALVFLQGLDMVKMERGALGASENWQATSRGVLAFERGEI